MLRPIAGIFMCESGERKWRGSMGANLASQAARLASAAALHRERAVVSVAA